MDESDIERNRKIKAKFLDDVDTDKLLRLIDYQKKEPSLFLGFTKKDWITFCIMASGWVMMLLTLIFSFHVK